MKEKETWLCTCVQVRVCVRIRDDKYDDFKKSTPIFDKADPSFSEPAIVWCLRPSHFRRVLAAYKLEDLNMALKEIKQSCNGKRGPLLK